MNTTYNKFLILIALVAITSGVFTYVSNNLDVLPSTQTSSALSTSSSQGGIPTTDTVSDVNDKISQDTAFLTTLVSLTKIQINTSIFSDAGFKALKDNTVVIEQVTPGRPNPFAPVNNNVITSNTPAYPVVTNEPTQVTDKSALLSGGVEDVNDNTITYFDYGPTESLGKSTPPVKQSLIGNFVTSVTNLKPKTAYFFRAVAKINGTVHNGEIISFTTN